MKKLTCILLLVLAALASACMWDYDTLYEETHGKPDLLAALTGRVDRNPPAYYERRIQIMLEKIAISPSDPLAYDNIAVAFDRLGKHDDAVVWISKKRRLLSQTKDENYRTEANEGTFRFHRWLTKGRPKDGLDDAKRAIDMIEKAVQLNPDAHFGREFAQILVMKWIVTIGEEKASKPLINYIFDSRGTRTHDTIRKGLIGLVSLGNAWESVDVIGAIGGLIDREASVSKIARLRIEELLKAGKHSFLGPNVDPNRLIWRPGNAMYKAALVEDFRRLRQEAVTEQARREAFVNGELGKGRHPDTNPDFWSGFDARPAKATPPSLSIRLDQWFSRNGVYVILASIIVLPIIAFFAIRKLIRAVAARKLK